MELDAREALIERRLSLLLAVEERIAVKQHVAALLGDWGGVLSGEALAAALVRVIDRHGAALSDDDRYAVAAALSRLGGVASMRVKKSFESLTTKPALK